MSGFGSFDTPGVLHQRKETIVVVTLRIGMELGYMLET